MANPEHLAILKQGVKVWNEWRMKATDILPDLSNVDLRKARLVGANLHSTDLSDAVLIDINLNGAGLAAAILVNANLTRANLSAADLSSTDLIGANLTEADLRFATFRQATLDEALLDGARLFYTTFVGVDLSQVNGLETIRHEGFSFVGLDTIYKSGGNIPEIFLRGCGVPENFITFMHSLTGKAFDFYSCFISHSAIDKRFCERLYAGLQAKGVRVWIFEEDAKWGETVWGEIDQGIKIYDKLVVVCSENSLQSSPVNREIERALIREDKESKGILFPIRLDDYIFNTWEHERKADVTRKVVGDFSGWDKDADKYDKAFDKLLKGLQAS